MTNQLELAKTTTDISVLDELKNSVDFLIRRVVARNKSSTTKILNHLSKDPVQNVKYMAVQNDNYFMTIDSLLNITHPCVSCEEDERTMIVECNNCRHLKEYSYNNK